MIIAIIGVSLLFVTIAFVVNEKTAKYLIAGYNTMSQEERARFSCESYLLFFRKFHLYLGISLLILGLILALFINEDTAGVFLAVYPVIAYIYFIWRNNNTK